MEWDVIGPCTKKLNVLVFIGKKVKHFKHHTNETAFASPLFAMAHATHRGLTCCMNLHLLSSYILFEALF